MATIFILGRTPELASAELAAVLGRPLSVVSPGVLRLPSEVPVPQELIARLGGTVKIATELSARYSAAAVAEDLATRTPSGTRVLFALSWLSGGRRGALADGLAVKRRLQARGVNARLVTSRAWQLPAAAINRHGAIEYLVLPGGSLARTVAAQDVDDFTRRDVGRPHRDLRSGTMPPKLARMMVNLARVPDGGSLLDPFCGSGTVLTEAMLSGVTSVIGADIAPKAIAESQANVRWLKQHYAESASVSCQVIRADVRELGKAMTGKRVDAIVTEPYLGPPLRGRPSRVHVETIIKELSSLYMAAFQQFAMVLKSGGRVVIALPEFVVRREVLTVPIQKEIERLGWRLQQGPFAYARADQYVRRRISVWMGVA